MKEHDLLLLLEKSISLPQGSTDIKKIATIYIIRNVILKNDVMLGLVTGKASGDVKTGSNFSLDFVVEVSKSFYLKMAEEQNSYCKFYVYHVESLAVGLREYRTIRMSEFFGMANTLI